jgi:indole-3-glycerol phosphate synthase
MSPFLQTMGQGSLQRVEEAARGRPLEELREDVLAIPPSRPLGGFGQTFDLIAEIKPRSPSEGSFPKLDPLTAANSYESGGAAMISVLTEPDAFGGSLDTLREIRAAVGVPVMGKDFLVDPYQVYEAREAGADGVLLIARMLTDERLEAMLDASDEIGVFALLEAFDGADLRRLSSAAAGRRNVLIGVNCRDLDTLEIVHERHGELAAGLPTGPVAVAESAMTGTADIERIARLGYRAALVGSALMRSKDAEILVRQMVEAGRRIVAVDQ